MMEYTPQNLEFAVSVFYNGEPQDRAKAHAWLTASQRAPEAWKFVWELLQPTKGTEVQFYAATTLHTKILRCWNEVPAENHEELKEKVLQAVFTYSKGPKIVTNRLCISLAAFILQQGTVDLAAILRPLSSAENTSLLLEVLTVIPEEYNSMTMGSALRARNRAALQLACPMVLVDMLRYLNTVYNDWKDAPSEETVHSWLIAATCAGSWLTLGGEDVCEQPTTLPERLPLCRALMAIVQVLYTWNDAVSDTALDACEACFTAIRAAAGVTDNKHPQATLEIITDLANLSTPIMAKDNVPNSINEELLSALITCCVTISEAHSSTLVSGVESGHVGCKQLIEILLAAQSAPGHYPVQESRSTLVFVVWYTIQDEAEMNEIWKGIFSRLVTALITKSEAPSDLAMSKDEQELLRCYRQDIADTVMYCYAMLGDWCWTTVETVYNAADTEVRKEAALHIFLALADAAPHKRAPDSLANMLEHAVRVAYTSDNHRMLNTALDCLGSYASWVGTIEEERGSDLGSSCVEAAGAALRRLPAAAALALRNLAAECPNAAAKHAHGIVLAAQSEVSADTWVRRQLLGAAGAALVHGAVLHAGSLLAPLAAQLCTQLTQQGEDPTASTGAAECTAALLAALCPRVQLSTELCKAVLPTLPAFTNHDALVEPMFSLLKQMLLNDCECLVNEIAQLSLAGFNRKPCTVGLDVVKLIVMLYGGEWSECPQFLHVCLACTLRVIATDQADASELTEVTFAMLLALLKKKPQHVEWIEDLLPQLVDLGVRSVNAKEAGCVRGACGWLAALCGRCSRALQPHARRLLHHAATAIGGATPRNQIEPFAELLLAMNRATWSRGEGDMGTWLRQTLEPAGFPSPHATDAHKQKFIAAVLKERSSKRRLQATIHEFALVCRDLIGTEYAQQTLASRQLIS